MGLSIFTFLELTEVTRLLPQSMFLYKMFFMQNKLNKRGKHRKKNLSMESLNCNIHYKYISVSYFHKKERKKH